MPHAADQTLCLLHGWGFDKRTLAGFAEKFLPEWNVINLALPGYGGTESCGPGVEQVAGALLPAVPDHSVLIGWSLGGMIGIRIASMKPLRLLVLLASTPCFVCKSDWPFGASPEVVDALALRIRDNPGRALRAFAHLSSKGDSRPRLSYRALTALLENNEAETGALLDGLHILRTADLRMEFSSLQCRVGMLLAANDALVSASMAGALLSLNPAMELVVIDAAGHAPFLSRPGQTRKLLLALLAHAHTHERA